MMEHLPGLSSTIGFQQYRASNTLMRGGINDYRRSKTIAGRTFGGPGKLGGFTADNVLQTPSQKAYYGSRANRAAKAQRAAQGSRTAQAAASAADDVAKSGSKLGKFGGGMQPWAKGARAEHWTLNPKALTRNRTLAGFEAAENPRFYNPFHFSRNMIGGQAVKNTAFREAIYGSGATIESIGKENVFQRGILSMMTTGRRLDVLEGKSSARAARKLSKARTQISNLAGMNNPTVTGIKTVSGGQFGRILPKSANQGIVLKAGQTTQIKGQIAFNDFMAQSGSKVGVSGNLMASAGATTGSRFTQGYVRGALGNINAGGLTDDAMRGATKAVTHMEKAIFKGIGSPSMNLGGKALEEGVFKTLGTKGTFKALATKEGASVLGARTAAMAIPGLNLLATAALVYDLGKMGGEVVKSGVNLAKDAVKSMKGSIDKPMLGMGYKDNEVAATSRARGVAAIQNSRLNARSALGSEGAMMAAHFG